MCFAKYHTYNGHIRLFLRDMFDIVVFNKG